MIVIKLGPQELRSLKGYRPCIDSDGLLRIEGRLNNFPKLFEEFKHSIILPSRCALTRFIILDIYIKNWHVGTQHILLLTRKKFWIVHGNAAVKHYVKDCSLCAINKAKPMSQLMSDLPLDRTVVTKKAFAKS